MKRGIRYLEQLSQDVRFCVRLLLKDPSFSATAITILAVAIGANTAVFNVVNAAILKSLPVAEPGQLVYLKNPSFSYPIFEQVRQRSPFFSGVFAWDVQSLTVSWGNPPEPAPVLLATGGFHSTLGVQPFRGRLLRAEDDRIGAEPVAVISHACWERRLGGDPGVLSRTVHVAGQPVAVVGVAPPGFFGVAPGMAPEITLPLALVTRLRPEEADVLQRPTQAWLHVMGRLSPGVSIEQADGAFQGVWPQVLEATTNPGLPADRRLRYLSRATSLEPAAAGFSRVRNRFSQPLWILLGLVGLLLMAACATVGNLLLARASARRREFAVRVALGASHGRLARQLLAEGLVLSALGAALGLVLALWASRFLVRLLSSSRDPIALALQPDARVFAFLLLATALTTFLFTLAPALRAGRLDPGPTLKDGGRAKQPGRGGVARSLVVSQVAVSMVLLCGAALFARSLERLISLDPGFNRDDVLVVSPDLSGAAYQGPAAVRFHAELLRRVRELPEVASASVSTFPPLTGGGAWTQSVSTDGAPPREGSGTVFFNAVSTGYFSTVGTALLRGRDFGPSDEAGGTRAVILNEALARRHFPGQDPLGRRITIGRDQSRQDLEVVGVVKDSKYRHLHEPASAIAYLPYSPQGAPATRLVLEVRGRAPLASVADAVRRELRRLDQNVPVRVDGMAERIRESLLIERVVAALSAFLGGAALLLASVGLYGLMAFSVGRRLGELGIRLALGARQVSILWLVLRDAVVLTALGALAGLGAAMALGRLVEGLLHGMPSTEPLALSAACALMMLVGALAGYLPARRASRLDPMVALRHE